MKSVDVEAIKMVADPPLRIIHVALARMTGHDMDDVPTRAQLTRDPQCQHLRTRRKRREELMNH
mgnify:FL=1